MAIDYTKILARLSEVTCSLSTTVDLETYLQSILSAAMELTHSETAVLLEYNESGQEFIFKFVPWFHRETLLNARVSANGSAAGWIFSHAQPLTINDMKNDTRQRVNPGMSASFEARSMLGVPLLTRNKPSGVCLVFNKSKNEIYNPQDVALLQMLASLASSAIYNDLLQNHSETSQTQARKLDQLKNEFIAITSHELRTPLGVILGHSTFLREIVGSEHQEQVDTIIRSASKLKEIIESLSSMDNQQSGSATLRARSVSVAQIIEDVSASFRDMAEQKGVTIKIEKDPQQKFLFDGDSGKLGIALSNLVKNSIMFTNQGGLVVIRGESTPGLIKVSVEDNGLGIPAKDQPHIFERFYQVESHLTRRHGGMGLGLAVAKAMIEMHNGSIWVESKEGVGSKFTFTLPV